MPSIFSYQKYITSEITREFVFPYDSGGCELGTVNGITYVSVPDGVTLPPQPTEINIIKVVLTEDEIKSIKLVSPHTKLIDARVREKIATKYATSDEIKLIRTSPSVEFDEYNAFVESCRLWGKTETEALGLLVPATTTIPPT